jgi:tetratricopeptide (TPR) repeat protein
MQATSNISPENQTAAKGSPAGSAAQSPTAVLHGQSKIKGIFSTQTMQKVGTGTTTRKVVKKSFWSAEELSKDTVEIQPLNLNYIPSGPKRVVPKEEFLDKFAPEPEFYVNTVYPKMQELSETVDRGEKHRNKGETFSAELEFNEALKIDEENVRANFGLGLTYLERGDEQKSQDIFERLVKLDAAFEAEHKHLFNEFGINLRKNNMLDQSLEYYNRALELSTADENLHYNIARVWFEKKDMAKTSEYLKNAFEMNPETPEIRKFLTYMHEKDLIPQDLRGQIPKPGEQEAPAKPEASAQTAEENKTVAPDADSAAEPQDSPDMENLSDSVAPEIPTTKKMNKSIQIDLS